MKIVVIGGTGLIGSKTVAILRQGGHEVIAASPNSGVNTITGEGVKEAVAGAQIVIDLANSPSFENRAVLEFLETAGRNLLPAEAAASVRHLRPSCSSPLRQTMLLSSSPRWRSPRRRTASSRSPARNERRLTKSSPVI
jgi:uncharacterized protein YbjT (DUF2867 family)